MDNFTYAILGGLYDTAGSANLTVTINGNDVFSGSAISATEPLGTGTPPTELCRWTSNVALSGTVALEINTDADRAFFAMIGHETADGPTAVLVNDEWQSLSANICMLELEYPDTASNNHAVSNVRIDGVVQNTPLNIFKPEAQSDIRGWHYYFDGSAVFACDYYTGPF